MRTLAIDLGSRRVGLALSDEGARLATPLDVLTVNCPEAALTPIAEIVRREAVRRIVVGLPLNMDDSLGPQARATLEWARKVQQQTQLPVLFVDERLSSFEAEQQLISRKRAGEKLTRRRKKAQLDAVAAAAFLQAFLDGRIRPFDFDSPATQR